MPSPRTVLLTGAAGTIGTAMRELLPGYGYALRPFDRRAVWDADDADGPDRRGQLAPVTAELTDGSAVRSALQGVDAVLHLAGIPAEAPFEQILDANIAGIHQLYEAVRLAGVPRVIFASSNHAVGFSPVPGESGQLLPADAAHRPDTFYGLSKCFGEDLAQLYWDRFGIETVSVRIGSFEAEPTDPRMLATWLSPADAARLFHAALTADEVGHTVVYGSSGNTRAWWDLAGARALGYTPRDDAEAYASQLPGGQGPVAGNDAQHTRVGGAFCNEELGRAN